MRKTLVSFVVLTLSLAVGCKKSDDSTTASDGSAPAATGATTPSVEQPVTVDIPAGTRIRVRTASTIDSSANSSGQTFRVSVDTPVIVNDDVVIPRGSAATLLLAESREAGHIKGRSELEVRLDKLTLQDQIYPVHTTVIDEKGKSRGKDTAVKAGIGAGAGALIGGLIGHGKGAAIGAAAGGGAGVGYQLMTHGQKVVIPAESVLSFRLRDPVTVTYRRSQNAQSN